LGNEAGFLVSLKKNSKKIFFKHELLAREGRIDLQHGGKGAILGFF
jgi:hypothetical protein